MVTTSSSTPGVVLPAAVLGLAGVLWLVLRGAGAGLAEAGQTRKPLPSANEIAKLPPDGGPEFNRLIHEKSPYLLQHARNPVDWHPWGLEALARAKKENKPIFLSVGYSTCHWCHVMERESFERQDVAALLNKHYIAVKVDREERPDVDRIYMLATQLMTGHGGWPNSVWLTPDGRPWYAGTYFPREDRLGRAGFKSLLVRLAEAWRTRRKDVLSRAEETSKVLKTYAAGGHVRATGRLSRELLDQAVGALGSAFDERSGGFGGAPKFPPHGALRLLFDRHRRTKDPAVLRMATRTLDAMARGGIHDHVGGGFHRYATDAVWLVPHFEKMLYDNAQLARAYVDGYVAAGEARYRHVARDTYEWVLREMADPAGGFHSALDADSEGEEGKFYLWSRKEVLDVLGKREGELFCRVYGVSEAGNFRDPVTGERPGTNIPHRADSITAAAAREKVPPADLERRLSAARKKLLARRVRRVWPHRDDKVLAGWNALMIGSLAYGGRLLNEPRYTAAAEKAAGFVLTKMRKNGRLLRTYRAGQAKLNAYLDDYAFLADACLELHAATGKGRWLDEARLLAEALLSHHRDPAGGGFFFTSRDHGDLLVRTKEPADSAIPSGNAVAADVLVRLARLTGDRKYLDAAGDTLETFQGFMERMPTATGSLLVATAAYLDAAEPARKPPTKPDALADKKPLRIEAYVSQRTVRPGGTVDLAVRIAIDRGWHINSHRPLQKHLTATAASLEKGPPAVLSDVTYPRGKEVRFAFHREALSVYEGTVWIRAVVRIGERARPGAVNLGVLITTQACNDRMCSPPETHALTLTLKVTPDAKAGAARHPSVFAGPRR